MKRKADLKEVRFGCKGDKVFLKHAAGFDITNSSLDFNFFWKKLKALLYWEKCFIFIIKSVNENSYKHLDLHKYVLADDKFCFLYFFP